MIRFMADADINRHILEGCLRRESAMDFISARDVGLAGAPDPEVLAAAAEQGRVLVSHDCRTMPRHFGDFLQTNGFSPGLILTPQSLPLGVVIEELLNIWGSTDTDDWVNRFLRLPGPWRNAVG